VVDAEQRVRETGGEGAVFGRIEMGEGWCNTRAQQHNGCRQFFDHGRRTPGFVFQAALPAGVQPSALSTRFVDAGYFGNRRAGRIGRRVKSPPQLGHVPPSTFSTQLLQKVHSKVQIIASGASGRRSLSQHSQFGLSSSIFLPHLIGWWTVTSLVPSGKVASTCTL
jgi:hypothetical protein